MPAPSTPTNFTLQTGDSYNYLSWDQMSGATSYIVQRSQDNVTYATIATVSGSPLATVYSDSTITTGTQYWYQVAAANGSGTSAYCTPQSIIPAPIGKVTLNYVRTLARQRADRVNSQFVTDVELNNYINASYKELYDILIQKYGDDYYVASTYTWTTDGSSVLYPLPPDFYKNLLVEVALNPQDNNSWITLRTFQRIQQNLWNYPNVYTFYGITNLRYRIDGNYLHIVPISTAGQTLRMWYAPRPAKLVQDNQIVDGVSGWEEYVIIRAAKYYLDKQESDTSKLDQELLFLKQRIEESATNRDAGQPDTISNTRTRAETWGGFGGPGYDGSGGGW